MQYSGEVASPTLTEGAVGTHLIRLMLPVLVEALVLALFPLATSYQLTTQDVPALSAMNSFASGIAVFGRLATVSLGIAATATIARAIGRNDSSLIRRLTWIALISAAVIIPLVTIVSFGIYPSLIGMSSIREYVENFAFEADVPASLRYVQMQCVAIGLMMLITVSNSILRATGDTLTPSLILTAAMGASYYLTQRYLSVVVSPELADVSQTISLISIACSAIALIASLAAVHTKKLLRPDVSSDITSEPVANLSTHSNGGQAFAKIGLLSLGAAVITTFGPNYTQARVLNPSSIFVLSASQILSAVLMVGFSATATAILPFVGQNHSAERRSRVVKALKLSCLFCLFWGVAMAAIVIGMRGQIVEAAEWLLNLDADASNLLMQILPVLPLSLLAGGIVQVAIAVFYASGRPLFSLILTAIQIIFLSPPLTYIAAREIGALGYWVAIAVANVLTAILAYLWCHHHLGQTIEA